MVECLSPPRTRGVWMRKLVVPNEGQPEIAPLPTVPTAIHNSVPLAPRDGACAPGSYSWGGEAGSARLASLSQLHSPRDYIPAEGTNPDF